MSVRGPYWPWRDPLVEAVVDAARTPALAARLLAVRDAAHHIALRGQSRPRRDGWGRENAAYLRELDAILRRDDDS